MLVKSIFLIGVLITTLSASWRFEKEVRLKKDDAAVILFKYDDIQKELRWRWTLYANNGLVVHRIFNSFVGQYILYVDEQRDSFKIPIKPRGATNTAPPYVLVQFKEYNEVTKEALFKLYLNDKREEIDWFFPNEGVQ